MDGDLGWWGMGVGGCWVCGGNLESLYRSGAPFFLGLFGDFRDLIVSLIISVNKLLCYGLWNVISSQMPKNAVQGIVDPLCQIASFFTYFFHAF